MIVFNAKSILRSKINGGWSLLPLRKATIRSGKQPSAYFAFYINYEDYNNSLRWDEHLRAVPKLTKSAYIINVKYNPSNVMNRIGIVKTIPVLK